MRILLLSIIMFSVCADADTPEEALLNTYGDRIFRPDPLTLCIVSTEGDSVFFQDCSGNSLHGFMPDKMALYSAVDYLDRINCWVVKFDGYDCGSWRIVNGITGQVDTVISVPQLSPDGMRLLCCHRDITGCFTANGLQIWRACPEGFTIEFEDLAVPWGPWNSFWKNDSTVLFEKTTWNYEQRDFVSRPGSLYVDSNGNWTPDNPDDWEQ